MEGRATPRLNLPARWFGLVALRAVHGLVASRLKGYLSFLATLGAGSRVHLSRSSVISAAATTAVPAATATFRTTTGATLGVLVPAAGVELLVVRTEGELVSTLNTGQGSITIGHFFHSLFF
jgi:hypothetical protein